MKIDVLGVLRFISYAHIKRYMEQSFAVCYCRSLRSKVPASSWWYTHEFCVVINRIRRCINFAYLSIVANCKMVQLHSCSSFAFSSTNSLNNFHIFNNSVNYVTSTGKRNYLWCMKICKLRKGWWARKSQYIKQPEEFVLFHLNQLHRVTVSVWRVFI